MSARGSPDIIVVGSAHMDVVARAARLPGAGESVVGDRYALHPGGKAGNQAIAAAQQGANTAIVARVGSDGFGDELRRALSGKLVDVTFLQRDDNAKTGLSPVLMANSGEYASIIVPGASQTLTPELVAAAMNALGSCTVLMVQLEIDLATTAAAISAGKVGGALVMLNASPISRLTMASRWSFWPDVDLLILNRDEASALAGIDLGDHTRALRAATDLRRRFGVRDVVVTLGANGVAVSSPAGNVLIPGHAVSVIDTLGAGDAFAGALAAALVRGEDLITATKLATVVGGIAVQREGAYDAAPTLAEARSVAASRLRLTEG